MTLSFEAVIDSPCTHNWVKEVAARIQTLDPVDALHDCQLLVELCKLQLKR